MFVSLVSANLSVLCVVSASLSFSLSGLCQSVWSLLVSVVSDILSGLCMIVCQSLWSPLVSLVFVGFSDLY